MAHVVVEYSDNLGPDADIPGMLQKIADSLAAADGVFAVGGIRVRAYRTSEYVVADGKGDDAFVNIDIGMASGRSEDFKQRYFAELFELVKAHLDPVYQRRTLAIAMYVSELPKLSFKHNNVHLRFRAGG